MPIIFQNFSRLFLEIFCAERAIRLRYKGSTFSWLLLLIKYLYLSGMWFGVAPKKNTKKTYVLKSLNYVIEIW